MFWDIYIDYVSPWYVLFMSKLWRGTISLVPVTFCSSSVPNGRHHLQTLMGDLLRTRMNYIISVCYGSYNPKMIITSSQGYETIIDHHTPNNSQKGYLSDRKGWSVCFLWIVSTGWMNGCSWSETLFPFRWCHIILIPDDTLHTTRSIPGNVQEIDEILC